MLTKRWREEFKQYFITLAFAPEKQMAFFHLKGPKSRKRI